MKTTAAILVCVALALLFRFGTAANFDLAFPVGPGIHRAIGLNILFWIFLGSAALLTLIKLARALRAEKQL